MQKNPLMMTPKTVLRKYGLLKSMNTIIKELNDESAYYEHWIYVVPEEATDEELMEIAYDEELLEDAVDCFKRMMTEYIEDGIFIDGKLY
jgi:hypothetical protein